MRFFHTADWHLGRIFHNVSLLEDQKYIIEQLISEINQCKPDAVIIAGDVYDKAIPPEGAIRLLEDFINRVGGELDVPIIMISGNHDSGARLSFASSVLQKANVHIIGKSELDTSPIILNDEHGEVYIYPLPYLTPLAARSLYKDSEIKTHQDVLERQTACILNDHPKDKRNLLVIHEFVTGAEESESERQLTVGGTSHIDSSIVSAFNYVALGHLHRPQSCGQEHIRYSGSLLKYSFSEVSHIKGVTEVIFDANGFSKCNSINLKPLRDMRIIQGKFDDILQKSRLDNCTNDFIRAELFDDTTIYEPMRRLKEVYPNILETKYIKQHNTQGISSEKSFHDLHKQGVIELFDEFYQHVCTESLNDNQQILVKNLVEQLEQTIR